MVKRTVAVVAATAALFVAGAGVAFAANSGPLNASTDGAATSSGTYNFKYVGCQWQSTPAYDGYVAGSFVVTKTKAHLNGKVDGYGWTKLVQGNSAKSYPYSFCLSGRDVIIHDTISIQACHEKVLADDCHSNTATR